MYLDAIESMRALDSLCFTATVTVERHDFAEIGVMTRVDLTLTRAPETKKTYLEMTTMFWFTHFTLLVWKIRVIPLRRSGIRGRKFQERPLEITSSSPISKFNRIRKSRLFTSLSWTSLAASGCSTGGEVMWGKRLAAWAGRAASRKWQGNERLERLCGN